MPAPLPHSLLLVFRYARLSMYAGRRFGDVYSLQSSDEGGGSGGRCFRSPDEMLQVLGLLDLTTMSVNTYAKVGGFRVWRGGFRV
jgi:hypothetical protein